MSTYIQPDNTRIYAQRRNRSLSPVLPHRTFDDLNNNEHLRQERMRARTRARVPYAVHENIWRRQQYTQELLRRNMTPLNLSTSTAPNDLCSCDVIRNTTTRRRPQRTYSIRVAPMPRSVHHHHVFYRQNFVPDPQVHVSIGVGERDNNLLSSLNQFVRVLETTRRFMGTSRGATHDVIERNTFPHKYKRIRRSSTTDDDDMEKCTICLSQFEIENEVR